MMMFRGGSSLLQPKIRGAPSRLLLPTASMAHRTAVSTASASLRLGSRRRNKLRAPLALRNKRGGKGVSLEVAKAMPLSVREMDNESLVTLGGMDNHEAHIEILKRQIMATDGCNYDDASLKFQEIAAKNREGMYMLSLPYQIGVATALTAGFMSIPLCFHLPMVEWFNHHYVTTDVPEPQDLETALEVGSWAWNWMEPPLGQVSFFLLCLQYSRNQLANLGIKPYTSIIKQKRAQRLADSFPQYDAGVVMAYSMSASIYQKD